MRAVHSYYRQLLALAEKLNKQLKREAPDQQVIADLFKKRKELRKKTKNFALEAEIAKSDNAAQSREKYLKLFKKLEVLNQNNQKLAEEKIAELKKDLAQTKAEKEDNAKFMQGVKNPRLIDFEG